jgi:AraC-like DNA-binding protein
MQAASPGWNVVTDESTHGARWNFRRGVASTRLLIQLAEELGMSHGELVGGLPLGPDVLDDPRGEVEAITELTVIERMVARLGHVPGLGLIAGSRYRLTTYGIWGYALISSPNLRSAAHMALRYLNLTFAFTDITLDEADGVATFTLGDDEVPAHLRRFVVERDAAGIQQITNDLFHRPVHALQSLSFRWPEPADVSAYEAVFGIRPRFNQSVNRSRLPSAMLDLPLPQAHPATATLCEQLCRQLLSERNDRPGVSARVRSRLMQTPGRMPSMEHIAAEWGMTSRTLRRHLVQEGVTFRELLDEVRVALACEMIGRANMGHREVADRLGFNDSSAFIQAFRRWKGVTPSEFRRTLGLPARGGQVGRKRS